MKKISLITICLATVALLFSCSRVRRSPGRAYMPDMSYSRAYETYASNEALHKAYPKINYNAMPVAGTVAKGDMSWVYPFTNDSTGYNQSSSVQNPIPDSVKMDMVEAERLYLIYCGICHGSKLDGNGPLYNGGNGPFIAAPKNLMGDDMKKLADGTMYHSITFGKGMMGSYASQLNPMQRWMVIDYIRSKQGVGATTATTTTAPADSASATTSGTN